MAPLCSSRRLQLVSAYFLSLLEYSVTLQATLRYLDSVPFKTGLPAVKLLGLLRVQRARLGLSHPFQAPRSSEWEE